MMWHTTFGEIEVIEPVFSRPGKTFRPFSSEAEVSGHSCSMPLQRVVVDFGADEAFGQVPEKLEEHYGISLSPSTIQVITESHAKAMLPLANKIQEIPKYDGCKVQVGEIDGSMIPIVQSDKEAKDKRKNKKLEWSEARLSLSYEQGCTIPKFAATFQGDVNDAGQSLHNSAILAGFGTETQFHAVGDGAPWISLQVADKFGSQSNYLLDFYHVCEYLSAAAQGAAPKETEKWMETQKALLKNNEYPVVLDNLRPYLEDDDIKDDKAPVRCCYRYLNNRTNQLDYKNAIENELPIGSGEIESAHRYIIQERLKISGAWWKPENAKSMLALRVIRANHQWKDYWFNLAKAA